MSADRAIVRSISHNEIVYLEWDKEDLNRLDLLCDDSVETEKVKEYWGVDKEGNEWRVHVYNS